MKKIFTMILFAAGTVSFASAQSHSEKTIAYNDNKKITTVFDQHSSFDKKPGVTYNNDFYAYKEKQAKLEKIDKEFDKKIEAVKWNRRLSSREKAKQIQLLQTQKKNEISKVEYDYAKATSKGYGYDSHKH